MSRRELAVSNANARGDLPAVLYPESPRPISAGHSQALESSQRVAPASWSWTVPLALPELARCHPAAAQRAAFELEQPLFLRFLHPPLRIHLPQSSHFRPSWVPAPLFPPRHVASPL